MLKQVILGLSLVAISATSSFGIDFSSDFDCRAYRYATYKFLVNEEYSKADTTYKLAVLKNAGTEAINKRFDQMYGKLSTDFLKENGIGYSINMDWGTLYISFCEFMRYANSDEDKKDLRKFQLFTTYSDAKAIYGKDMRLSLRDTAYFNTNYVYNELNSPDTGAEYLLTMFAETKQKNSVFSPFVKKVINHDYKGAKEYIKQVNAKSGINEVYKELENRCER